MAEIDDNAHLKSGTGTHIFRLKGLQTKVFLNQNPNYAPYDTPPVSASYFMDISINSLLLDDLIFISAASNYIDNSRWPDISFSLGRINNSSKTDIDTYFVNHITKDIGPAWLAKNITGGYNNSDIFHNEDELVQQYITMDKSISNLYYLQISPTDLSDTKKLALNKISIHDITTNTPVTLYSPDASGADFVTPGWVTGSDPSYALTTSDSEYLLYDTLDSSGVFIKYGFYTQIGHAYKINIDCCNNNQLSDFNSHINVSIIDSLNNKPLYLHYDDLDGNNINLDSSSVLQIHDGSTNILDGSTNIVFYDNSIKSQLIKVLKRGGTSEANPVSGMNLAQYYGSKYNLGREIMLSMFASDNELTINRINDVLTYQPPPIVYDVTLSDGTIGDNSGNLVFYLNGVETPVLHLTRGLNYEFNVDGADMSSNKFVFTKELKNDGVDICLNPVDTTKVITSGLTYETGYALNNVKYLNPVSFEDFYKQYDRHTGGIDHYTYENDKNVAMFFSNTTTQVFLEANSSYDIYIIGGGGGGGSAGTTNNPGGGGGGGGMLKLKTITPTADKMIQIHAGSGGAPTVSGTDSYVIIDTYTFTALGGSAGNTTTPGNGGETNVNYSNQVEISSNGGNGGQAPYGGVGGNGSNGGPGGGGGGGGNGVGGNGGNGNTLYFTGGGGGGAGDVLSHAGGGGGSGYYSGGAGAGQHTPSEDGYGLPGTFGAKGYEVNTYIRASYGGGGGAFGGGGGGAGDQVAIGTSTAPGSGGSGAIIICSTGNIYSYPLGFTNNARKIKWSIPFNEDNVPLNSFYGSDISDNLGGNIVINKNPIYGAMKFIDGDLIQFHLDYSQKAIVDASGVAVDSSGNKLGSNPIEEQDYIVRLHVHDLFHYPKFKAMSYDNSDNLITDDTSLNSYYDFSTYYQFSAGINEDTRNWQNWVTLDSSGIYLNNEASGNILGLQFATDSDEFGIGICSDICDNIWEEKPWEINKVPTDVSMISSNKFIWAFDASLNGNEYQYKIEDLSGTVQDYDNSKVHNQKYNWKIEIKSDGTLCLNTSTDSALNVDSSYSDIQLASDIRYYLWIGSKDASFNFTNLKYLPETRVFDDEVTLGPPVQTYNQGSTSSYNPYNVVEQTEVTYNLSTADITYAVTQAGTPISRIYIDGNRYNEASPLELIVGNTYRFNLENPTNIGTTLAFSSEPSGVGIIYSDLNYNFITYNGIPGVYDTSQGSRDRSPYVDVQITDNAPNKFYYYDASRNNSDISGTIIINTSVTNHHVTVVNSGSDNKYYINGSAVTSPLQLPVGRHRFIQSHSTNSAHPLKISTTSDGIHNSGIEYTDLVTYNGTLGTYDSYTELRIIDNIENYYTYCANHSGMGFDISNSGYNASLSPHVINVTVDNGVFQLSPTATLTANDTYIFTQSDSTNSGHPFRIITTTDNNDYTTGVSYYGTPGQSGSYTQLIVPSNYNSEDLSYKCQYHGDMGAAFT